MAEYDEAMDNQIELARFWTSEAGLSFARAVSKSLHQKRVQVGEKIPEEYEKYKEYNVDEFVFACLPLFHAECYYWSPQMLAIVKEAARSLPDSWSLRREDIPHTTGFFWFANPPREGLHAVSWQTAVADKNEVGVRPEVLHFSDKGINEFNTLNISTFVKPNDPDWHYPMLPSILTLYVGESIRDYKLFRVRYAQKWNVDLKVFEEDIEILKLFATMLSFIQQKIMVPSRFTVSRSTRKRLEKLSEKPETEVNVISLRKVVHKRSGDEGEMVDWSCRWYVTGHWRNQWYGSTKNYHPIFVNTYIKGPDDKPLKDPGQKLFAVVR
jgi:hypothetical protein